MLRHRREVDESTSATQSLIYCNSHFGQSALASTNLVIITGVPGANSSKSIQLGILDVSAILPGMSAEDVLAETFQLAPRLEKLGYSRLWFAEHHTASVAHSCPEILVTLVASLTGRMRIGTAGVLLRLHSPLRVAKVFRTLGVLYPGRIDLGIARGGAEKHIEDLLRSGATTETDYDKKVEELVRLLQGVPGVPVNPESRQLPEIWLLGSNRTSMQLAAEQGTAFCFARFLPKGGANTVETIATYRRSFTPGSVLQAPNCSIAVAGICAETDEIATSLLSANLAFSAFPNIVGGPRTWRRELLRLHEQTGVHEFIILDLCQSFSARIRSYELLAHEMELAQRGTGALHTD